MKQFIPVLCRSDLGDGGWSLHAPGATDRAIAEGDEFYLVTGPAKWVCGQWRDGQPDCVDPGCPLELADGELSDIAPDVPAWRAACPEYPAMEG